MKNSKFKIQNSKLFFMGLPRRVILTCHTERCCRSAHTDFSTAPNGSARNDKVWILAGDIEPSEARTKSPHLKPLRIKSGAQTREKRRRQFDSFKLAKRPSPRGKRRSRRGFRAAGFAPLLTDQKRQRKNCAGVLRRFCGQKRQKKKRRNDAGQKRQKKRPPKESLF